MNQTAKLLSLMISGLLFVDAASCAEIDFAHDIVPILRAHCAKCHSGDKKQGGLSLDTRELLLAGGESGEVVVPGASSQSLLFERITTKDDSRRSTSGSRYVVSFMTWHQWHQPAWTLRRIGRRSSRARAKASAVHSFQSGASPTGPATIGRAPPQLLTRRTPTRTSARTTMVLRARAPIGFW